MLPFWTSSNSSWFWLECKTQWAVYFKEEIYFTYIILEIIKWKEIPSVNLDPGIWLIQELFCEMLIQMICPVCAPEIRVDLWKFLLIYVLLSKLKKRGKRSYCLLKHLISSLLFDFFKWYLWFLLSFILFLRNLVPFYCHYYWMIKRCSLGML